MKELQNESNFTELMVISEEIKTAPLGDVWEEYLRRENIESDYLSKVSEYEKTVLGERK